MSQLPNETIVYALRASHSMMHRFVDDLKPEEFEYQPSDGVNCVAWILGHLVMVNRGVLGRIGVTELPMLPDGFEARFTATREKAGKQGGYGDAKQLVTLFDAHQDLLVRAVMTADPSSFAAPSARQHPFFSTVGESIHFASGLHIAMHVGQISIIRRNLGYPPAA